MTTIRRIYMFVVCFISLQWSAISIKILLDAFLRWLFTGQVSDLRSVVFPLAVIIVGAPVFLGHWLWAEWLARRDLAERRCLERHLYLHLTLSLLTVYVAIAIYSGVEALLRLLLPAALTGAPPRDDALAIFISSLPTLAATGALWAYHRFVTAQAEQADPTPPAQRPALLTFFANLGFAGIGMTLIAIGIYLLLDDVLRLRDDGLMTTFSAGAGMLVAGSALWIYHQWGLARDPNAQASFKIALQWLYAQFFSFVGLMLTATGLIGAQVWVIQFLNRQTDTSLPVGLAALITGLPLLIYHEWRLYRTPATTDLKLLRQLYAAGANLVGLGLALGGAFAGLEWLFNPIGGRHAPVPETLAWLLPGGLIWAYYEINLYQAEKSLRWWQALGLSLVGQVVTLVGVVGLQAWAMSLLSAPPESLATALAGILSGAPVLVYYEWLVHRHQRDGQIGLRWFTAWSAHSLGVMLVTVGLLQSLRWLFELIGGAHPRVPVGATGLAAGLMMWAYARWVMRRSGAGEPLLTRLMVFGFSGLGVSLTAFGLIGLQEWLLARFIGEPVFHLPDALAGLITGVPLWLYFWRWAGQLFARGPAAEQKSDLRKAYLYLIIYLAVHGAIITIGLLMNGLLRALFGLPTTGSLGLPLSIISASVALWAYHAFVLQSDIKRAGETTLQAGMQRLYWYMVAGVGLLAALLGLAGTVSGLVRLLAALLAGDGISPALREQLANALAALVAGLPVWASAWFPAQHAATAPTATGAEMRRSLLRKAYLYFYLLTATLTTLVAAVTVVFQLLNAVLGLFRNGNLLANLGQPIGYTVIGLGLWLYHVWVLRGDGRFGQQEKQQARQAAEVQNTEAQQRLKARWATFRIVVVEADDGHFGQTLLHALQREMPHLNVTAVGLTPESRAMLLAPTAEPPTTPDEITQLLSASLIIAPWTAAFPDGPIAQSQAIKLIVPVPIKGMHWVGVPSAAATPATVIYAIQQILLKHIPPAPPPTAQVLEPAEA